MRGLLDGSCWDMAYPAGLSEYCKLVLSLALQWARWFLRRRSQMPATMPARTVTGSMAARAIFPPSERPEDGGDDAVHSVEDVAVLVMVLVAAVAPAMKMGFANTEPLNVELVVDSAWTS